MDERVFEIEYEAWVHQGARPGSSGICLRFLLCALIYAKREAVYQVDTTTQVMLTDQWIPIDRPYEHRLIDELVHRERRFLKPLHFESRQAAALANVLPFDIVSPFMTLAEATLTSAKSHTFRSRIFSK